VTSSWFFLSTHNCSYFLDDWTVRRRHVQIGTAVYCGQPCTCAGRYFVGERSPSWGECRKCIT